MERVQWIGAAAAVVDRRVLAGRHPAFGEGRWVVRREPPAHGRPAHDERADGSVVVGDRLPVVLNPRNGI